MSWFAIQRVSDGKFLLRQSLKGRCLLTWMDFDEGHSPHLYDRQSAAEKALKLWRKGSWTRRSGGGGIRLVPDTARTDQVRVVPVQILVIDTTTEPEREAQQRQRTSVLD